jgi:hypothetical protein
MKKIWAFTDIGSPGKNRVRYRYRDSWYDEKNG